MRKRLYNLLPLLFIILFAVIQPTEVQATTANSGTCGVNINWELDSNGTLTISGIGDMPDNYDLDEVESDLWRSIKASIKSVIIGEGVSSIGSDMFRFCSNLATIYIPDSVTYIGNETFFGCTSLTNVSIPKNLIDIGDKAFYNCSNLNGFWVDEANPNYSSDQYGVLFNKDKTILLKAPEALSGSYTVPDGVKILDSYYEQFDAPATAAFSDCTKLTSITLPDSVTIIGETAFANCSSLSKINIPNNVKEIRYISFMNCTNLTSISIPGNETIIADYAFSGCTNLTQITLGKSIQEIGPDAFNNCDNIWHVLYSSTEEEAITVNFYTWTDEGKQLFLHPTCHYNCTGNEVFDLTNKKCSICLANCNHSWDNGKVTKEATCKEVGIKTFSCTICTKTKNEDIAKLTSHNYDGGKVTKEATCKEDGVKTYTCAVCQQNKAETIAKLTTHTPGPAATATTDQTCTVCGTVLAKATGETLPTTEPSADPTTEPTTEPSVESTMQPTTQSSTEATEEPTIPTTTTPTEPTGTDAEDSGSATWIITATVIVLGGGVSAGVILWKKKH